MRPRRLWIWPFVTVLALIGLAADQTSGGVAMHLREAAWRDVSWPLPRDQFPAGRAFACDESQCGARLRLTVRPKVGFCNCLTGVSDDDELERVGDVDLLGVGVAPAEAGRAIAVGARSGRARLYAIGDARALSIAFNERCDVVVATVTGTALQDADAAIVSFLKSPRVSAWIDKSLGP